MGMHELIEKYATTGNEDTEYLTTVILEEILNDAELMQEILFPVLKARITHDLRVLALSIERNSLLETKPTANPAADRLAFLNERFYVPGIGFITWAEATIEHHLRRIQYLNDKAQGILNTAGRHEEAIKQIKTAGVKTLGEVHKKPSRRKLAS